MMTDPIADMLTRIRNAIMVKHDHVLIPASKIKIAIAQILKDEGFLNGFEILREKGKPGRVIKIHLKYTEPGKEPVLHGLKRVSKPGQRIYVGAKEIPRIYGGLGVAILSTSKGVMTDKQARRLNVGGELLCYVW